MNGRYAQKLSVLPFIVGPAGRLQQTVLVAPMLTFDFGHEFVGEVSKFTVVERALSSLVPQLHWLRRHLVISLTIQTTAVESFSGRSGLNVTFGAIVPPHQLATPALAERTMAAFRRYFRRQFGAELNVDAVATALNTGDTSSASWDADTLVSVFEQEFGFDTIAPFNTLQGWWRYARSRVRLRRISGLRAFDSLGDVAVFFGRVDGALRPFKASVEPDEDSIRHSSLLIATAGSVALFGTYTTLFGTETPWDFRFVMMVCSAGTAALAVGEALRCFGSAARTQVSVASSATLGVAGAVAMVSLLTCAHACYRLWIAR